MKAQRRNIVIIASLFGKIFVKLNIVEQTQMMTTMTFRFLFREQKGKFDTEMFIEGVDSSGAAHFKTAFEKLYKTAKWRAIDVPKDSISPEPPGCVQPVKRKLSEILPEERDGDGDVGIEADMCSICFQNIDPTGEHRRCELPRCKHAFGLSCIFTWCTTKNRPRPEADLEAIMDGGDSQRPSDDGDTGCETPQREQCPLCKGVFTLGIGEAGELDEMITSKTKVMCDPLGCGQPDKTRSSKKLSEEKCKRIEANRVKALAKKVGMKKDHKVPGADFGAHNEIG